METMSVDKLATLMKPEPFVLAALHEVVAEAVAHDGEVVSPALDILVEHGMATHENGHWGFTRDGLNTLTEADHESYYTLVDKFNADRNERQLVELQAKARAAAEDAVEFGAVEVLDGVYHLTELGISRDGEVACYSLNSKGGTYHLYWSKWEGVRVGEEYKRSGAVLPDYMDSSQWTRMKNRILASLTDSEKELLLPRQRAQKPLSKAEQFIKDIMLESCRKVKEG